MRFKNLDIYVELLCVIIIQIIKLKKIKYRFWLFEIRYIIFIWKKYNFIKIKKI